VVVVSVFVSVLVAGVDSVVTVFVESVFVSVLVAGAAAALMAFLALAFSAGFTTVVVFSVFFSAGAAGATVSVFCSHAPRSAALARMQINFFIVVDWLPVLGLSLNRNKASFRPC
jgi:hypothetical protein